MRLPEKFGKYESSAPRRFLIAWRSIVSLADASLVLCFYIQFSDMQASPPHDPRVIQTYGLQSSPALYLDVVESHGPWFNNVGASPSQV